MDIVIISNFCSNLSGNGNNRFLYLAKLLSKRHSVELITSSFSHGEKKQRCAAEIVDLPFKVTLVDEPGYSKNISPQRFFSHQTWGANVLEYLRSRKKPDLIYCAIPSLTAPAKVGEYCKEIGCRFVLDVQDLWPEAFAMVFSVPIISSLAFIPFKNLADKAYSSADAIIAVSETYMRRASLANSKAAIKKIVYLGTDLPEFDSYVSTGGDACNHGAITLAYCGTLGNSYDLDLAIDAVRIAQDRTGRRIRFLVMGSGPYEAQFKEHASETGIDCRFTGRLPYGDMCRLLSASDIAINPIKKGSAGSIINKHADYAAAGVPVINTQESPEYRNLVECYSMGVNCSCGSVEETAKALSLLVNNDDLRIKMGVNSRKCAEELFDRSRTYRELAELLETI